MKKKDAVSALPVSNRRSGAALIMAIVLLLISTSICMSMVRTSSLRQQRFEYRQWKLQANLLAESAIDKAAHRLQKQPEAFEELWEVAVNDEAGETLITVEPMKPNRFAVTAVATYPSDVPQRAQTTVQTIVDVNDDSSEQEPAE